VAAGSAEQLVDRLSAYLSEDVPQGDVDCRTPAVLHGGRAETDDGVQALPVPVDLEWILSEEVAGSDLVHPGGHGLGGEEGFAEADDVLVRVDTDVTEIRELVDDDRLDGRDLHVPAARRRRCTGSSRRPRGRVESRRRGGRWASTPRGRCPRR